MLCKVVRQKGSTLIEVLLVIAIFSLLASAALPRYNHAAGRRDLDIAARQLAADMRWMQQFSTNLIAGSSELGLPFDPHPSLKFYTTAPHGYFITIGGVAVKKRIFPAGIQVQGSYPIISFGINGYFNTLYGLEIPLLYRNQTKKVIVDSAGRIRID